MQESSLPLEIWRNILLFSDYYSNYFQLYSTNKFFKQLLDSIFLDYMQSNYPTILLPNLQNQIPFYEQHFQITDKPWLKKLIFFNCKYDSSLPIFFSLPSTNRPSLQHFEIPTVSEVVPLQYTMKGNDEEDDVNIQANSPFFIHPYFIRYFEIKIENMNSGCSIGLTHKQYNQLAQPGWRSCSIGYHADDGGIFVERGFPSVSFKDYNSGDVVGCGMLQLNTQRKVIFFTKNRQLFGEFFAIDTNSKQFELFPTIGFWGKNVTVKANFGQQPFEFTNWLLLNRVSTIRSDCSVSDFLIRGETDLFEDFEDEWLEDDDDEEDDDEEWIEEEHSDEEMEEDE